MLNVLQPSIFQSIAYFPTNGFISPLIFVSTRVHLFAIMHTHYFQEVSQERKRQEKGAKTDEVENSKACQLEFGSYCLWSTEHKVIMKDSVVKRLKDQLFVARSYYPSIAKLQGQEVLTQEMKQNIQDHERVLSASAVDADLPSL